MKLSDRVAVITGGNSGIGRSIADAFRREGARVAVFGRTDERATAALFLASEDSSYVTGAELAADGGLAQV